METRSGDLGGTQRHCVTLPGFSKVTVHLDWNLARNVDGNKKDCPRHFISKRKTRETCGLAAEWGRKRQDRGHEEG